jgi:2,3-bisphosphoglycerate-dependent phosphoglycerate mutase
MSYTLTFLRHGESEGNAAGIIQGQLDYPLTEKGRQQARALAQLWQTQQVMFDYVIASPLQRARHTAEAVAAALNLPLEIDPAWLERSFGVGEGKNPEEIRRQNPKVDFHHPFYSIAEGGESALDLYLRASAALQTIMRRPAGRYLIVSHGAILNMAIYAVMGLAPQGHIGSPRFRFGNTAYTTWT